MPSVKLSIQPQLCGPVSFGTIDVIRAVQSCAGLSLVEAKALVDQCVFHGEFVAVFHSETVTITGVTDADADGLITKLRGLPDAPPLDVSTECQRSP